MHTSIARCLRSYLTGSAAPYAASSLVSCTRSFWACWRDERSLRRSAYCGQLKDLRDSAPVCASQANYVAVYTDSSSPSMQDIAGGMPRHTVSSLPLDSAMMPAVVSAIRRSRSCDSAWALSSAACFYNRQLWLRRLRADSSLLERLRLMGMPRSLLVRPSRAETAHHCHSCISEEVK